MELMSLHLHNRKSMRPVTHEAWTFSVYSVLPLSLEHGGPPPLETLNDELISIP